MRELKKTLGKIAFYYLLLIINGILSHGLISHQFPTRNVPTLFLLGLAVCLVMYFHHRVINKGEISFLIKLISWLALLLLLLRGVKYSAFANIDVLARHTWYAYYVPILGMPLCLFYIALLISSKGEPYISKLWIGALSLTLVLLALTMTNDLHQQAFRFHEDFRNWNDDYSHGWLFYVLNAWQFSLYIASIVILIRKCRVSTSRKNAWIILIPASIGTLMYVLLLLNAVPKIAGSTLFEFPEAHIFTVIVALECCMELGLVPTNNDYKKVFRNLSVKAEITDDKGKPVFISSNATPLSKEDFSLPNASRIAEHTLLYKMKLPGGYGFWQEDVAELDRINEELSEAKETLEQETELIRLQNELQKQQASLKQRAFLYDRIAEATEGESQAITKLTALARQEKDKQKKEEYLRHIVLLGCVIKRYANLMLLCQEKDEIEVGELKVSLSEYLHYLNYYGVPGELIGESEGTLPSIAALVIFKTFCALIDDNLSSLQGAFVHLSPSSRRLRLILEGGKAHLSQKNKKRLLDAGIKADIQEEDEVAYFTFLLQIKEGKA
ncbi:MAG: histidine kinase N-terminal 7TM domain-containing protein [Bacilli bacterium]|nr:histidine kinase N-terminal 7TM domain-containing protein [Bacilli bacterium]